MSGTRVLAGAALRTGAAVAVGLVSSSGRGRRADDALVALLNRDRGPIVDALSTGVTELGSIAASASAAAVLAAVGRRRAAADALSAASLMWLVGQGAKQLARRPRPYDASGSRRLIDKPNGSSWPSSHPAVLLTFVTVAARDLRLSGRTRTGLAVLAGVVGLTRVQVGVHYPSDVTSGLLLGRAVADLWTAIGDPFRVGRG